MQTIVPSAKSLLCPISPLRVGETTARLTGLLAAALIGVYALTGAGPIMLALAIDYGVRAGSRWRHSPLSWLAARLVGALRLPNRPIDKAPKMFAARVGMLFGGVQVVLDMRLCTTGEVWQVIERLPPRLPPGAKLCLVATGPRRRHSWVPLPNVDIRLLAVFHRAGSAQAGGIAPVRSTIRR